MQATVKRMSGSELLCYSHQSCLAVAAPKIKPNMSPKRVIKVKTKGSSSSAVRSKVPVQEVNRLVRQGKKICEPVLLHPRK